jgi:hypothetical protein
MYTLSRVVPTGYSVLAALLLPCLAVAQAPDAARAASPATVPAAGGSGTLLRLGTGLTRGFELGNRTGLSVPLVLGAEHHLKPAVSIYGDAFAGLDLKRYRPADGTRESRISSYGFDAGARYYYNQEKRRRKGRPTGPFVGNYLALQSASYFNPDGTPEYRGTNLTVQWGIQRRLGRYGRLDAYAGLGVSRSPAYSYTGLDYGSYPYTNPVYITRRNPVSFGLSPEIGVKLSLGTVVKRS